MKKKFQHIIAFTLVELVIAITISSIIFLGVLNLVGDTLHELGVANRSSKMIINLDSVINKFEVFNSSYNNKKLLVDKPNGEGTDVLLFSNSGASKGVIVGLIDPVSKKIYNTTSSYPLYNKKHIAYRFLNQSELSDINATPTEVYNLTFNNDKIFYDIYVKDFQLALFNSNTIADLKISLLLGYGEEKEGTAWKNIGNTDIFNINLNF